MSRSWRHAAIVTLALGLVLFLGACDRMNLSPASTSWDFASWDAGTWQ